MKRILKDYLTFSKKERMAVIILLLVIVACIAMPYLYRPKPGPPLINQALVDFIAKANTASQKDSTVPEPATLLYDAKSTTEVIHHNLFAFDPNTVSAEGWARLGVNERTIRTILNYRNKGGRFRQPDDIRKIWGISKEEADRLLPFVRIAETPGNIFSFGKKQEKISNRKPALIDINTATVEEWAALPGVGEALANRITRYRERIGGFVASDQLKKTYGISDSLYRVISPYLRTEQATVPKLDLNTVSAYDLKMRTGIADALARAIVVYRQQYGAYTSVADLKKIVFLPDSVFQRLAKYVKVN